MLGLNYPRLRIGRGDVISFPCACVLNSGWYGLFGVLIVDQVCVYRYAVERVGIPGTIYTSYPRLISWYSVPLPWLFYFLAKIVWTSLGGFIRIHIKMSGELSKNDTVVRECEHLECMPQVSFVRSYLLIVIFFTYAVIWFIFPQC